MSPAPSQAADVPKPRLGFLGLGWIGRLRLEALAQAQAARIVAIADPAPEAVEAARALAPAARPLASMQALLDLELDGLVIATPSALHAAQARAALERGLAVFCQKPLARTAAEVRQVVAAARRADRLLAVDFSYRFVSGLAALRRRVLAGELGEIFAVELMFHNAYGPDKPWFYDLAQAGGGCVMDLGSHLVDLALWVLDFPEVEAVSSRLYRQGRPLAPPMEQVEDYALAELVLAGGTGVRLACSWGLAAGCDALIEAAFYGTQGGAALRNANGSFYDFTVERFHGTRRERLAGYPDAWGGRALVDWALRLAGDGRFDSQAERLVEVHRVLDRIYGRCEF